MSYFLQWEDLPCNVQTWQQRPDCETSYLLEVKFITGTVLDIGCGIGILRQFLTGKNQYYGLDVTRKFLHVAKGNRINASCLQLPFSNNSFGTTLLKDLLLHLPKDCYKECLSEAFRVASHRVILNEGKMAKETKYEIGEKQGKYFFFWNIYGEKDIFEYAKSCGAKTIETFGRKDKPDWQLTVFYK